MTIIVRSQLMARIQEHGERAYPEEGSGFLLGLDGEFRTVHDVFPLGNAREDGARHNRYLIGPEDYLKAEREAEIRSLDVIGVFHSHPDHPEVPSEFDREWAQPQFSYVITSVQAGKAIGSKSWRLSDDRSRFIEEEVELG